MIASVTLYTAGPACQQCRLTRTRLEALGIDFHEVDLTDPANTGERDFVVRSLGYRQAPVIIVDGSPAMHWSGLRLDLIDALAAPTGGAT